MEADDFQSHFNWSKVYIIKFFESVTEGHCSPKFNILNWNINEYPNLLWYSNMNIFGAAQDLGPSYYNTGFNINTDLYLEIQNEFIQSKRITTSIKNRSKFSNFHNAFHLENNCVI